MGGGSSPIEVYLPRNVTKHFVLTKVWQIFKLSPPDYNGGGGEQKPCKIKLLSCLVRNNKET